MLYAFVAFLIEAAIRQFFQRFAVSGRPVVDYGPVIVAANHPNQAVDSFLIGSLYKRPVSFLAKSTLFRNRALAAVFRALHMVPVYRAHDKSDTALNLEMFTDVVARLHQGGVVAIFPEGTSTEARQLLPLKTGVARIALQAESTKDWRANVIVQPIGITYLSPRLFQSSVALVVGEPLTVVSYRAEYEASPAKAIKSLTAEIEQRLRLVTVSIPSLELQNDIERITQLFDDQPEMREHMQFIANRATEFSTLMPAETAAVRAELEALSCMGWGLGFFGVGSQALISQHITSVQLWGVLIGRALHAMPYYATRFAVQLLVKDPHNLASVKIGLGVLFYSLWYVAFFSALYAISGMSLIASLALVVVVMVLGDRTNQYTDGAMIYLRVFLSRVFSRTGTKQAYHLKVEEFTARREDLRARLIATTEAYQNGRH